jgi:hypothetical protein
MITSAGRTAWAASVATAVSAVAIASWPGDGISVRLVVASAILFGYLAALAHRVRRAARRPALSAISRR